MRTKPMQLTVMAVAAMAVFAVAAVMLLSGGNPAQADTASLTTDNGGRLAPEQGGPGGGPPGGGDTPGGGDPTATPTPKPTRVHASPEPCPGQEGNSHTEAADVVDSGHIALFDVWWNPDEGELTNTSCPPTVAHGSEGDVRTASSVNIDETIIHIPNSARIDLSTSTTYTQTKYPELWAADNEENRDINDDGTPDGVGDRIVWALPACPPDGTAGANDLCLMFSAALLNPADWTYAPVEDATESAVPPVVTVEYHIDHVHQIDIDKQDPRYTLAYDVPAVSATGRISSLWNSANARVAVMPVAPGGYERPMWFFTSRGTYELQVHIRGNPEQDATALGGLDPLAKELSVTSDVREYIIHVGAEADLSVDVSVAPTDSADTSIDPGDNVDITITASNAGPETAPDTKVDVTLPEGLTYSSHKPTGATLADSDGDGIWTWAIGELAVTNDDNTDTTDDSPTLIITATVAQGTRGTEQKVKATISATETVEITETDENGVKTVREYELLVLDPDTENNNAEVTVIPHSIPNADPVFGVRCLIDHGLAVNTDVCTEIVVFDLDAADTFGDSNAEIRNLATDLSGTHSEYFKTFIDTNRDLGIKVKKAGYPRQPIILDLTVKDGKDEHSNPDSSIDDRIKVVIVVRGGNDYNAN